MNDRSSSRPGLVIFPTKSRSSLAHLADPFITCIQAPTKVLLMALKFQLRVIALDRRLDARRRFTTIIKSLKAIAKERYSDSGFPPVIKSMLVYEEARALLGNPLKRAVAEAIWRRHGSGQFPEELWDNLESYKHATARARHFVAIVTDREPESVKKTMQRQRKRWRSGGT